MHWEREGCTPSFCLLKTFCWHHSWAFSYAELVAAFASAVGPPLLPSLATPVAALLRPFLCACSAEILFLPHLSGPGFLRLVSGAGFPAPVVLSCCPVHVLESSMPACSLQHGQQNRLDASSLALFKEG